MKKTSLRIISMLLILVTVFATMTLAVEAATTGIDGAISVTSATVSNGKLTIKYTVKRNLPSSYFDLKLGFKYPSSYRLKFSYINLAGKAKGSYTKTFNVGYVGKITVCTELVARNYKETKNHKTIFVTPFSSKTFYHTITRSDVVAKRINDYVGTTVLALIPIPGYKELKFAVTAFGVAQEIFGIFDKTPSMAEGQYYVYTVTYKDYKCTNNLYIYASKSSYSAHKGAIYHSVSTINYNV